jgi:hypothetical protein
MAPFSLAALATVSWSALPAAALPAAATLQLRLVPPRPVAVRVVGGRPRFVGTPERPVVDLAGPWRADEGWWAGATGGGAALIRDEYDVLLDDGSLLRIAREPAGWSVWGVYD